MRAAEYEVRLDVFHGPLDLLLFLIRRAEVDIFDIPVATITQQYLDLLSRAGLHSIDIETAGEFLVMAATLMEIKSRMLAPVGAASDSAEGLAAAPDMPGRKPIGDPRAELVRQLLEYKRYRDATDQLDSIRRDWEDRFPAGAAGLLRPEAADSHGLDDDDQDATPLDLDDITLADLVDAFARLLVAVDLDRVGEHHVELDETPVEEHADAIVATLAAARHACAGGAGAAEHGGEVEFSTLLRRRTRSEMIGVFLAMLELVKQRRVRFRQADGPEGDRGAERGSILLSLLDEAESAAAEATPASTREE